MNMNTSNMNTAKHMLKHSKLYGSKMPINNPQIILPETLNSDMFASDLALVNTSIALLALFAFTVNKAVEEVTYHEQLEKYSCQCEGSDLFAVWLMENV